LTREWKQIGGASLLQSQCNLTIPMMLKHYFPTGLNESAEPGIKGGWLSPQFIFQSEMGQNFWMAIVAWTVCFLLTVLISLLTRRVKTDQELAGLVYSLTPKPGADLQPWYFQPVILGIIVLVAVILLNIMFW